MKSTSLALFSQTSLRPILSKKSKKPKFNYLRDAVQKAAEAEDHFKTLNPSAVVKLAAIKSTKIRRRGKESVLSRLPPTKGIRSLRFKRTVPGSIKDVTYGTDESFRRIPVDPDHPFSRIHPFPLSKLVPSYRSKQLTMRCFPHGVLSVPEYPRQDPPFRLYTANNEGKGRRVMPMMFNLNISSIHKSAVIRRSLKTRIQEALRLIITQGAYSPEPGTILFDPRRIGVEKWILKDWTYVTIPTLEMYRMTMSEYIKEVSIALLRLKKFGQVLERQWAKTRSQKQGTSASPPLMSSSSKSEAYATFPDPPEASKIRNTRLAKLGIPVSDTHTEQLPVLGNGSAMSAAIHESWRDYDAGSLLLSASSQAWRQKTNDAPKTQDTTKKAIRGRSPRPSGLNPAPRASVMPPAPGPTEIIRTATSKSPPKLKAALGRNSRKSQAWKNREHVGPGGKA